MIKRLSPFILNEQQEEDRALAEWIFNSHWWIETSPGYYNCKWCTEFHNSSMGISKEQRLCEANPSVIKFLEDHQQQKFKFSGLDPVREENKSNENKDN